MSSDPTARAADSPMPMEVSPENKSMFPAQVPPRLRPIVNKAQAMDTSEGPGVLEEKVRALKQALDGVASNDTRSLNVEASDTPVADSTEAAMSDDQVARTGEERAKKQMPQQELEAYNAWCVGSFQPPAVNDWDVIKKKDQALMKNAKDFRAGPVDLTALYKTSKLTLQHLAGWLGDSSLSTEQARDALKALARVRRVRERINNSQSRTGGTGTRAITAGPDGKKPKSSQKDAAVLRGVLKSVRVVRKDLQARIQKVMMALKDVEDDTQGKLRELGGGGNKNGGRKPLARTGERNLPGGGHRKRDVIGHCGGGIVVPANAGEQDVVAELGEGAIHPVKDPEAGTCDEMQA